MVNSMLSYSGLSEGFWREAMLTTCYLLNRVPNKRNKTTPYDLWYKKRLNLSFLQVWGCRAVVRVSDPKKKTLGKKGIDCIFVGYAKHSKEYRFYVIEPNAFVSIDTIIESRDAIFDENRFSSIPRPKDIIPNSDESQRDDHLNDVPSEIPKPRRGKRARKAKSYGSDFQLYLVEGLRDQIGSQYSYCYSIEEDPRTYNEAMQSRDVAFWKEAIDDEIGSIMENNTWVLSDLPPGCKPLGCKWIFKRKMKVDGTIDKFKARLVIQGFRQKEGIDYFDTYAPVARITTIRLLLALAAIHNLVIHQMDVKTTFLNGDLEEEVYMKQPEGFVMPGNEHKVCKLVKSLYGLKQAPKQKFDGSGKGVIICLYVDDMLIFGTDQNQVDKTKKFLSSKFSMKDMGEADVILGIKIKRENKWIVITQSHYIEKILKKFNREDYSPVSTLMDLVEKLMPNTSKLVDQLEYSRAIGCLMYVMTSTRPDIAYAVGRLSRFTSNPSRQHWHAITRVFKYLKGTMNYGLSYVGYPSVLEGYSDASWINHVEDSSSTSGWVFLLGGGAIS
ncbi:zinc finger, CCHC-type containing protein [Tanacetum coccineum]